MSSIFNRVDCWPAVAVAIIVICYGFGRFCVVYDADDRRLRARFPRAQEVLMLTVCAVGVVTFGAIFTIQTYCGIVEWFGRGDNASYFMAIVAIAGLNVAFFVIELVLMIEGIYAKTRAGRRWLSTPPAPAPEADRTVGFKDPPETVAAPEAVEKEIRVKSF